MHIKTKSIYSGFLVVAFLSMPGLVFAQWTPPTQSPPDGNTTTPINISGTAQSKVGGLLLNTGNATNGLIIQYGKVGIGNTSPAYKLDINGDAHATNFYVSNGFWYLSDRNLKTSIRPLEHSLQNITRLQGVSFEWKDTKKPAIGLIAQDVEKIFPTMVSSNAEGFKSVEYGNLVAPLIEAVKEQQKQIDELRSELEKLKELR